MQETQPIQSKAEGKWMSRCYHSLLIAGLVGAVAAIHQTILIYGLANSFFGIFAQQQILFLLPAIFFGFAVACFSIAKIHQTKGRVPLATKATITLILASTFLFPFLPSTYISDPAGGLRTIVKGQNPDSYVGESIAVFRSVFGWENTSSTESDSNIETLRYSDKIVTVSNGKVVAVQKL